MDLKRVKGRSRLVPAGFALMIAGIALPRALAVLADGLPEGIGKETVGIAGLILYGGFLAGLVLAAVGIVRNRRDMRG